MNITRLNYENYFLLYVDGELSIAEMQAVKSFAAENKDLADELKMLLQTKLSSEENYYFENKSTLLRTTSAHINSINYEEKFLLFVDKEVSEQEAEETLDFVSKHPIYQELFETIQQTKLPDEKISFPNKDSLYRREEKRKPIIFMQWWKVAVAAALIGLIVLIGFFVPYHNQSATIVKTKINTNPTELKNKQNTTIVKSQNEAPIFVQQKNTITKKSTITPDINITLEQPNSAESLIAKTEVSQQKKEQGTIILNSNNSISANNNHNIEIPSNSHTNQIIAVSNRILETEQSNFVKPAVYKELDTDDDSKSLYLGSVEINKDKLRGLLRKASSLFKVKNKNEEEKIELSNSHTLE